MSAFWLIFGAIMLASIPIADSPGEALKFLAAGLLLGTRVQRLVDAWAKRHGVRP